MAPALTEPGQTQNFKLLSSHSSPASPTAAVRAVSDEIFFCDVARHLKSDNILNGDSVCINGTKLKASLGSLKPNRPRIVIPAESCRAPCLDVVSDCKGENGDSSLMMNSDSSNQDQSNNMGLQKSPGMAPTLEAGSFLKESFLPPEMDQLFKNLGAAINSSDIGQNMDELLQVFKSMESTVEDGTLDEALTGVQQENVETDGMFPIPDGADLSTAFNFERDIFNEVEDICVDSQVNIPDAVDADTSMQPVKECNANERIEEARKKQFQSERRCEFLLRRLRKLQAKSMGRHASEEINGLMQETQRLMAETQTQALSEEVSRERRIPRTINQMLGQFEESAHSAANSRVSQHRYFGSGSSDRTATVPSGQDAVEISADVRAEVEKVAGQLHTQFRMVENAMDSDVTASSSGGESCDEMVSYNNPHQQPLSIMKRAAWKWAQERAGVASRWTWLQAQISDLEYRIRQHTEIHRQIRLNKGEVKLGEPVGQGAEPAHTLNGFHTNSADGVKDPPECMGATGTCRTRPFTRTNFRKRRLLNTAGLHLVSKKAARPSNIRCGCRLPLACCALCTGRSDPTYPREQPEQLTVQEKIALLDPAYHPVLSFPSDVPQSIHLEALMRTPEWQQKMQRAAHKSSQRVIERREREREREREAYDELRSKKHVEHRKKYQRLKKPSHTLANIQKIKKKLTRGRKPKNHDAESLLRHKRKHKFRRNSSLGHTGYDETCPDELRVEVSGSGHPSPAPSPGDERLHTFAVERTEALRRKRENSYDIDNIVIPHSLASSARVEKLQYKEILTPKWRIVDPEPAFDSKNGGIRRSSHESDVEDVSDETMMLRHERCEMEERKKFMAYVKNANPGRSRTHRRTDSRAGSSGANTPDPMSPNTPADLLGDGASPITSPPGTPGAAPAEHEPCTSSSVVASIASHFARRSRTLSQSKLAREEFARSATPDYDEVAPYEPRSFPLSDEVYEKMLKAMPDWYPAQPYMESNPSSVVDQNELTDVEMQENADPVGESLPGSPSTDTDSAPGEEDPNDPEWTIGEKESSVKR